MLQKRWLAAAAALLAAVLLAAAYFITPGCPLPVFGQGDLLIFWNGGGELSLTWPEADPGVEYLVSVRSSSQHFEERCTEPHAAFSGFLDGERLRISVRAVREGENLLGMVRQVKSWSALKASLDAVELNALTMEGEAEPGSVTLSWDGKQGKRYEVCTLDNGVYQPVAATAGTSLALRFGSDDSELPIPAYGQSLQLVVREGVSGKGYKLYGPPSNLLTFDRGDLLNDTLFLEWEQTGPRQYTFLWSEARGDRYEFQQWRNGGWETVFRVASKAQSFSYDTGRVTSGSLLRCRVVSKDDLGGELVSNEISFYVDIDTLYATVWPIMDLAYYDSPNASNAQGKVPAGTTLCVLEETGQWFQVRYKDQYVYIDNRFCMINLPEYIGDYCSYDVTNSYESIFKIHDRPIAQITEQVIPGYENVQTAEGFLVPYLYPCAQKLLSAAKAAMADGYHLKIYEAYRPHQATRYLYDTTQAQINYPALTLNDQGIAIDPSTGNRVNLATGLMLDAATGNWVPRVNPAPEPEEEEPNEDETPEAPETAEPPQDPTTVTVPVIQEPPVIPENPEGVENPTEPETPEPEPEMPAPEPETLPTETMALYAPKRLEPDQEDEGGFQRDTTAKTTNPSTSAYDTNFKIMTDNGRFRLGSFLAAVTSAHNRGIALDLTLETLEERTELTMQSAMHDLSWYSANYRNNDNAKLLAKYMTATGMNGLTSEWWHFQDDDTRNAIGLNTYLEKGVSAAGLVRDDSGWRCRTADGTFAQNTVVTIDGIRYTVDADGYVIE